MKIILLNNSSELGLYLGRKSAVRAVQSIRDYKVTARLDGQKVLFVINPEIPSFF